MASNSTTSPFKRIVVGADGSSAGHDAIVLGAKLASASGAALALVNVFRPSLFPIGGMTDRRMLRSQAEKSLRADRRRLAPEATSHVLSDRSAARALTHHAVRWNADHAVRWNADLVVIGSASQTPVGRVGISSRGRQLLSDAPFALAIAQRGLSKREFELGSIGVGYDGGPEAEAALEAAAALAGGAQSELSVLSVIENQVPHFSDRQWMELDDWEHLWEPQRKDAQRGAETATERIGVDCEVTAVVGDPASELRELSSRVDLIVAGSRRWGTLARIWSGGVGEALVSDAGCSLLIVPRPTGAKHRAARRRSAQAETTLSNSR